MTPEQTKLVERIRLQLAHYPAQREVSMFGGRAFMVNEKMVVSAQKDGSLLVRVAAEQHDELLERPGAEQAEMGKGRDMGPGWIDVAADTVTDPEHLTFWVEVALTYNRTVTKPTESQA